MFGMWKSVVEKWQSGRDLLVDGVVGKLSGGYFVMWLVAFEVKVGVLRGCLDVKDGGFGCVESVYF